MYRKLLTSILGFFLLLPAVSSAQKGEVDTANTLLYRVSGNGLKSPSYVYGTIHAICQDDIQLHDSLYTLLPKCQSLVLESSFDELGPMDMMRLSKMRGDTSINMLLSEVELETVKDFFQDKLGMPLSEVSQMKPILIGGIAVTALLNCSVLQIASVENVLRIEADKHKLNAQYLESPEFQLKVLDSIPYTEQAKQLHHMVKNFKESKKDFAKLIEAYQSMDLIALDSLMKNDIQGLAKEPSILLNRNYTWIAKMQGMMAKQACFFAVGAGHLAGEESILKLLRKAGYTVHPVLQP